MRIFSSLKHALSLNFLLVATLPVFCFGILAINQMYQQQIQGINQLNEAHAIDVSEDVDEFMGEVLFDLMIVADTVSNDSMLKPGKIDDYLQTTVRHSHFFESIYVLDARRHVTALGVIPQIAGRLSDYLDLDLSSHQLFLDNPVILDPVWSDTFVSLVTGEPSITLGIPIKQGIILGNVNLKSLSELLKRYSVGRNSEFAVIDREGTLVAHSHPEYALQRENFSNHPAVVTGLQGKRVTVEHAHDDKRLLESVVPIPVTKWVAWVGLDLDQVLAPIYRLRNLLVGFMCLAIAMAVVIALTNARRLLRPLIELGRQTGQIAAGDYSLKVKPTGFRELDDLGSQFQAMSRAVRVREESIIDSEKRFRNLVNSIEGVVWEIDIESGQRLFISRRVEDMFGYDRKRWLNEPEFGDELVDPRDRELVNQCYRQFADAGDTGECEYRMLDAKGQVIWVRDLVTVVRDKEAPARLLGVMIDITLQKQLEEELRRSEQNYREIFNATSEAIFIHDPATGLILDVNNAVLEMFGYAYEEVMKLSIKDLSQGESPYSGADAKAKLREATTTGLNVFEWRSRHKSGELFWTEVALKQAEIGGEKRIIAVVRDISERKIAEQNLQELNERLQLLIERMPLSCIVWDADFKVQLWNPMAEKIFGYSRDETLGCDPYFLIPNEDVREMVEDVWIRLKAGDVAAHTINQNCTRDGRVISCEWFNTPLFAADGGFIGCISMTQDISERKTAEQELAKYREHLEDLVAERTEQLKKTQEELVASERLAVLGQLTATVSHEIRNPLGTVANALYLIRDQVEDLGLDQLEHPLLLAERNVERCDNIISELLDFSRKRLLEVMAIDADVWLNELLDEQVWPESLDICREITSGAVIMADPERLRRAVINVLTNALQALEELVESNERSPRLEIRAVINDGRYKILLTDNGPGIPEEHLDKIFEPMFSTKNFGVGLGVPIIKNILEDHRGGVIYESEFGRGTTVILWIPLAVSDEGKNSIED